MKVSDIDWEIQQLWMSLITMSELEKLLFQEKKQISLKERLRN